jgi:hypothetical protein
MKKPKHPLTLEEGLVLLQKRGENESLSIADILGILPGKGRFLILLAFSLPFCQPIQIPGFSTPFGLAILFIGLRMLFGKNAWLPKRFLNKKVPPKLLKKITSNTLRCLRFLHRWIHPRLQWVCTSTVMHIFTALTIALLGCVLALPIPIPFSNLSTAWSIFLIALGLLEDDGVCVLLGYLIAVLTLVGLIIGALSLKYVI